MSEPYCVCRIRSHAVSSCTKWCNGFIDMSAMQQWSLICCRGATVTVVARSSDSYTHSVPCSLCWAVFHLARGTCIIFFFCQTSTKFLSDFVMNRWINDWAKTNKDAQWTCNEICYFPTLLPEFSHSVFRELKWVVAIQVLLPPSSPCSIVIHRNSLHFTGYWHPLIASAFIAQVHFMLH